MKLVYCLLFITLQSAAQNIPTRWDELTASDWPIALEKSNYTCILPIGILEKHGPYSQYFIFFVMDRLHWRCLLAKLS